MDFEAYKRSVDLVALAERYGYRPLRRKSSARQVVMVHPDTHERVIITRDHENHWYFNPHDDQDKGTAIDFLLQREAGDWQRVQAIVGGQASLRRPTSTWQPTPRPPLPDFEATCQPLTYRSYLYQRGLSDATLDHPAFRGRIFNQGQHVAFPLYGGQRIVGLDLKGPGFKGYAPGSRKAEGCWYSHPAQMGQAGEMIITESSLDALSYHQLFPANTRLYLSLGGTLSHGQGYLIQLLCDGLRPQRLILACDHDVAGQRFNLHLATLLGPAEGQPHWAALLESIGPDRSRLTLSLGPDFRLQRQALPLLLSGLEAPDLTWLGPAEQDQGHHWSLTFAHRADLIHTLTRLVIRLRGLSQWLSVERPRAKDWNDQLRSPEPPNQPTS